MPGKRKLIWFCLVSFATWDTVETFTQHLSWLKGNLPWQWKIPTADSPGTFHHKTAFSDETKYSRNWLEGKWLFLFVESASPVKRKLGQVEKGKRRVFEDLLTFKKSGSMKNQLCCKEESWLNLLVQKEKIKIATQMEWSTVYEMVRPRSLPLTCICQQKCVSFPRLFPYLLLNLPEYTGRR